MSAELDDFARELAEDFAAFKESALEGVKLIAKEAHEKILARTPIDRGHLVANWQMSLGERERRRIAETKGRRGRKVRLSRSEAEGLSLRSQDVLNGLQDPFTEVYLNNNQPYASFVEDGTSKTSPVGMAKATLAELDAKALVIGEV